MAAPIPWPCPSWKVLDRSQVVARRAGVHSIGDWQGNYINPAEHVSTWNLRLHRRLHLRKLEKPPVSICCPNSVASPHVKIIQSRACPATSCFCLHCSLDYFTPNTACLISQSFIRLHGILPLRKKYDKGKG